MTTNTATKLSGYSSIFLDGIRILAGSTVVFVHARDQWMPARAKTPLNPGADFAHAAVIAFFVLSGYVISYTTTNNNRGPLKYAKARLTRLYSMLIPALLISAIIQLLVADYNPTVSAEYLRGASWPRYLLSTFYLNEVGLISAAPPINRPLWSLSYEFWYYAIFGLVLFRKKNWMFTALIIGACLFAGPKILLMMPIWLAGCFAYGKKYILKNTTIAWCLVWGLLTLSFLLMLFMPPLPFALGTPPFFYANQFITDYLIALPFAAALWVMPLERTITVRKKATTFFRKVADLTFPVYVLHHPFLILWRSVIKFRVNDTMQMWEAIAIVLCISVLLGIFLEKKKNNWSDLFDSIIYKLPVKFIKRGRNNDDFYSKSVNNGYPNRTSKGILLSQKD